jgi:hypothetical protein
MYFNSKELVLSNFFFIRVFNNKINEKCYKKVLYKIMKKDNLIALKFI